MTTGWRGILAGALGLAAFEVVVANQGAPERVGGIFTSAASAVNRFLDPTVPAFGPAAAKPAPAANTTSTPAPAAASPAPYPPANRIPPNTLTRFGGPN